AEIAGCTENSALLLFETMKLTTCPVSPAPALMAVAQGDTDFAPESSSTATSGPSMKLGTWFTGVLVTTMRNVTGADVSTPPFAVPRLSFSTRVMVADPLAVAAGV